MTREKLIQQIKQKQSFLCIGLDADMQKIPRQHLDVDDPVFDFNKAIIDATHHFAVAYKPNTAFYEADGVKGWTSLQKTINYLNQHYPEVLTIADAKRGDIGNTSAMYAKAFFEDLAFDAVTVAPYMGKDSIEPFLKFKDKFTILLALTSNEGAYDFQVRRVEYDNELITLFESVLKVSLEWENSENLMYVVGATKAEYFKEIRNIVPDSFLLVPGVGAQGGSLQEVCKYGLNNDVGLLINSSRGIIYASSEKDFAEKAASEAKKLQLAMRQILQKHL